ncbi:MAG: hypothetical protein FWG18_03740, partial [Alphaproteobacteria bacterium]|nr:hypothetical protein [Alphaproteobacteria bacterium]
MNVEFIKDFAGAIEIMKNVEPFYDSKSRLVTNAWRRENLNMEFMGEHYGFQESDFYVCKIDGKPI